MKIAMFSFAPLLILTLSAFADGPLVRPEVLKTAFQKKSLKETGLDSPNQPLNFSGLYETQLPDKVEHVGGAVSTNDYSLAWIKYSGRSIILGSKLIGYYAKSKSTASPEEATLPLQQIIAALEPPKLKEKQWIAIGNCHFGKEVVAAIGSPSKASGVWRPALAWRLDPSKKAFVSIKPSTVECQDEGEGT